KQVTATSPAADLVAYYGGPASDVYFQRARKTLAGAHVDAVVAVDFFSSRAGVLCGVAEAVRLLSEILEADDEAWAVAEGADMDAKETVLRVRAPYSRFGVYETARDDPSLRRHGEGGARLRRAHGRRRAPDRPRGHVQGRGRGSAPRRRGSGQAAARRAPRHAERARRRDRGPGEGGAGAARP